MPDERVELALHDDGGAGRGNCLAGQVEREEAGRFARAPEPFRVHDRLVIGIRLPALKAGKSVGVGIEEDQRMPRDVGRQESRGADPGRGDAAGAQGCGEAGRVIQRAHGQAGQQGLGNAPRRQIAPAGGGDSRVGEEDLLEVGRGRRQHAAHRLRIGRRGPIGDPGAFSQERDGGVEGGAALVARMAEVLEGGADPGLPVAAREAVPEAPPLGHRERRVPVRMRPAGTPGDPSAPGAPEGVQGEEPATSPDVGVSKPLEDGAPRAGRGAHRAHQV